MKLHAILENVAVKIKTHKKQFLITGGIIGLIILMLFGAKIFLFLNFFLGNDVIVKLDASSKYFNLAYGEQDKVDFTASVNTNPFCTAHCEFKYVDLSDTLVIENASFTLSAGFPLRKDYVIEPPPLGKGQRLYRFELECNSVSSALCHTDGEPTRREVILTLDYDLNSTQKILKSQLKNKLDLVPDRISVVKNIESSSFDTLQNLQMYDEASLLLKKLNAVSELTSSYIVRLNELERLWRVEDYSELDKYAGQMLYDLTASEDVVASINVSLISLVQNHNDLLNKMSYVKSRLELHKGRPFLTNALFDDINRVVDEFNIVTSLLNKQNSLLLKSQAVSKLEDMEQNLWLKIEQLSIRASIEKMVGVVLDYDLLCLAADECVTHVSIYDLANTSDFDYSEACKQVTDLHAKLGGVNNSLSANFVSQGYPTDPDFWVNISQLVFNMKQNLTRSYLSRIDPNADNAGLVKKSLARHSYKNSSEFTGFNLTPAIVGELAVQAVEPCIKINHSFSEITNNTLVSVNRTLPQKFTVDNIFSEQSSQCCILGDCRSCCTTPECNSNSETYPIVFLHGHAFNKDVSAEYSLDAFNKIQSRLEKDGFLNAGAISLYSTQSYPQGALGRSGVPLTFKASYYLDLFKQQENYVVVQTKSENIDAYAIRVKELIDEIKYVSGKPKVKIVAASMGGLVARRYAQIFGEQDVDRMILIGTPNNGVVGNIADFCPLIGENLECRDMKTGSLFLNKLNRGTPPNIPIYNIVGTGCVMGSDKGDGIVLEKNSVLDHATNFLVNGKCTKLKPLHSKLLDIDAYPEVYYSILASIK